MKQESTSVPSSKVYIVTSASVIDQPICAIFSELHLAEQYIAAFTDKHGDMRIEEWTINKDASKIEKNYKAYTVMMSINGESFQVQRADHPDFEVKPVHNWAGRHLMTTVFAKDTRQAMRLAVKRFQTYMETKNIDELFQAPPQHLDTDTLLSRIENGITPRLETSKLYS